MDPLGWCCVGAGLIAAGAPGWSESVQDLQVEAAPAVGDPAVKTPAAEAPAPMAGDVQVEADQRAWASTVELYGFLPIRLTGTTTIRGFSADTDLDLGDVLSRLQWATSLRGSVESGRIGLLTDLSYARVGDQPTRTTSRGRFTGNGSLTAVQGMYDLALRYRFGAPESAVGKPGQFSVIPYAGIRLLQARLDASAQVRGNGDRGLRVEREGSFGRTWVQPLVGTQATVFLSPKLRAFARADVGGWGLSGARNLSGNAQVGLGYAVGNNTDLNLSWRYLGIEYKNGLSDRPSGYTSYQNGVELGLKFFF
ncbi:hypothetical protein [Synechococcus sp. CBW1107]|uniref:hypothetical protein n=2 Tax=unclassified Synechococcus TaxID=2626047 RepID=UPI002AD31112|nr:hypothetical protein [Synechococcus sp. CBW1107]MEA5422566.1 hypothetical protein [Synechococcus sp. CCY9202]